MSRPSALTVNYADFLSALNEAAAKKERIEPPEKEHWARFVAEHRVRETMFKAYCRELSDTLQPVIIDGDGPWCGYYLYSSADEVAIKWHRE